MSAGKNRITTGTGTLLVSASAGSGKTYQLTQRVLHLLTETETDISQILAITFTDAAAAEMRARIYSALMEAHREAADPERRERLDRHLTRFSSNRISTIHSFCQSLLRDNPEELAAIPVLRDPFDPEGPAAALEQGFRLMDAFTEQNRMPGWRNAFFTRYSADPDLAAWLVDESAENVRELLAQGARLDPALLDHQARLTLDDWRQLTAGVLEGWLHQAEAAAGHLYGTASRYATLFPTPPENSLAWADSVCTASGGLSKNKVVRAMKDSIPGELDEAAAGFSTIRQLIKNATFLKDEWTTLPRLLPELMASIREHSSHAFGQREYLAWQNQRRFALSALRWKSWVRYQRFSEGLIDHDDSIWLASELLRRFPACASDCQRRFRHILVDEFQDTDAVQWSIITAIRSNRPDDSLLMVGDLKQAIYGFRGGEVSVMKNAASTYPDTEMIDLPVSYRSNAAMVSFANAVFEELMPGAGATRAYEAPFAKAHLPDEHRKPHQNLPGALRLLEVTGPGWTAALDPELAERVEAESPEAWEAARAAHFLRHIRDAETVEPGWERIRDLLRSRKRTAGVLLRYKSHAALWARVFRLFGFSVHVSSGSRFFDRRELVDLYVLLAFLADREHTAALAGLLRSPWVNLSDAGLMQLKACVDGSDDTAHRNSYWTVLHEGRWRSLDLLPADRDVLELAVPWMQEAAGSVRNRRVSDVVLDLLHRTAVTSGYDDPDEAGAVLARACALLRDQEDQGIASVMELAEFLRINRAEKSDEKDPPPAGEPEITIMTVHKSKGLEFPLVILGEPGKRGGSGLELEICPTDEPFSLHDASFRLASVRIPLPDRDERGDFTVHLELKRRNIAREKAELIRLFYVAITRAETHFLFANHNNWEKNATSEFLSIWNRVRDIVIRTLQLRSLDSGAPEFYHAAGVVPLLEPEIRDILATLEQDTTVTASALPEAWVAAFARNRSLVREAASAAARKPVPITSLTGEKAPAFELPADPEADEEPRVRGTLVHRLLELAARGQLPEAARLEQIRAHTGTAVANPDEVLRQARMAWDALQHRFPGARQLVPEHVFQADLPGTGLVNGIADLLVEDAGGQWHIVDFKTSAWTDRLRERAREAGYFEQLNLYAAVLHSLAGLEIPAERRLLLLTAGPEPVWLDAR